MIYKKEINDLLMKNNPPIKPSDYNWIPGYDPKVVDDLLSPLLYPDPRHNQMNKEAKDKVLKILDTKNIVGSKRD